MSSGKPPVVSCKIEESIIEELDKITKFLNYPNRSETLRRAIYKFVNSYKQD
jgi:metal-responsive CopG/Arc/MetJ family transcriptional regulator